MMSFCVVPWSARWVDAVLLGGDDVERQQPRRRRVDRHRRVHLVERDAVHQRAPCRPGGRRARRPCRPRRARARGRGRSRSGSAGRRRPTGPSGPWPGSAVQLVGRLGRRVARVGAHHPRPVALGQAVRRRHCAAIVRFAPGGSSARRAPRCGCARSTRATASRAARPARPAAAAAVRRGGRLRRRSATSSSAHLVALCGLRAGRAACSTSAAGSAGSRGRSRAT